MGYKIVMQANTLMSIFGENTAKSKIIQILATNEPLTAKQIHYKLKRQFAVTSTYQAMHKTLKQMLEEEILTKKTKTYSLNQTWVENYKKTAEQLDAKTKTNPKELSLDDMQEGETVHLPFKGILEVGWFLVDKLMITNNPDKKPCLALWRFCYSIIGLESKHLIGLKNAFTQNEWYAFVEEKNKVDQMFGETLKSYGLKKIQYGIKCATPLSDKMIIGDYIAEMIYPSTFRKLWEIQNRLPIKIIEFNLAKHLMNMRELQPRIEVIITKNSKLADEFRKEYIHQNKAKK